MMLNVLGMKQANSTQPCIWCEATQKNLEKKGIKRNEIITNESLNFIQNDLFDDDAIDDFYGMIKVFEIMQNHFSRR